MGRPTIENSWMLSSSSLSSASAFGSDKEGEWKDTIGLTSPLGLQKRLAENDSLPKQPLRRGSEHDPSSPCPKIPVYIDEEDKPLDRGFAADEAGNADSMPAVPIRRSTNHQEGETPRSRPNDDTHDLLAHLQTTIERESHHQDYADDADDEQTTPRRRQSVLSSSSSSLSSHESLQRRSRHSASAKSSSKKKTTKDKKLRKSTTKGDKDKKKKKKSRVRSSTSNIDINDPGTSIHSSTTTKKRNTKIPTKITTSGSDDSKATSPKVSSKIPPTNVSPKVSPKISPATGALTLSKQLSATSITKSPVTPRQDKEKLSLSDQKSPASSKSPTFSPTGSSRKIRYMPKRPPKPPS